MIFRTAVKIMATGQPGMEAFATMGCPRNKLVSFPFFVPLQNFNMNLKEVAPNEPISIVSGGRLDNSLKGFDIALEGLKRLTYDKGIISYRYLICGTGPDLDALKDLVTRLDLNDFVEFKGWVESKEMTRMLQRAQILLHPAIYDPFPVIILEAMANGVVVLGSDASGSRVIA